METVFCKARLQWKVIVPNRFSHRLKVCGLCDVCLSSLRILAHFEPLSLQNGRGLFLVFLSTQWVSAGALTGTSHRGFPLNGSERTFGQHVSQLFCCAHMSDGNRIIKSTRWVRETCLEQGLRPFMIIRTTASLASKMKNLAGNELSGMLYGTWSIISNGI